METTNDNVNVKCTRCGAKATVGGKDYFYTCPVCHGQINKEAAKKNYEGVSPSGDVNRSSTVSTKPVLCRACVACGKIHFNPNTHGFQNNYCIECKSCNTPSKLVEIDYPLDKFAERVDFNLDKGEFTIFNESVKKKLYSVQRELYEKYVMNWTTINKTSRSYEINMKNLYPNGKNAVKHSSSDHSKDFVFGIVGIILIILFFIAFPTLGIIAAIGLVCWIIHEVNEHNGTNEKRRQKEFEQIGKEYEEAVESQKAGTPWAKRYSTHPCPHCGHYKVREATWDDKRYSVAFWGAASSKIGTRYKCDHCGNMWS